MQYMGGKSRIAKDIAWIMTMSRGRRTRFIEPFVGGGSVAALAAPRFQSAILADANLDLILMWKALQDGWIPPTKVSLAEWTALKSAEPSPERAFAGFACSYGGKWFAGYAADNSGNKYARASARSLLRKVAPLGHAEFHHFDYRAASDFVTADSVIYCDPPYVGTTAYGATGTFDNSTFWATAQEWADAGALVFVSEYEAPDVWHPVWRKTPQVSLSAKRGQSALEQLYAMPSTIEAAGLTRYAERYQHANV